MNILNIEQGSPEWLAARMKHFTASEAPAMMGASKYSSRTDLLDLKKGKVKKVDPGTQFIFDKGHAAEESARSIVELNEGEDFAPVVCSVEIDSLKLLASLDGIGELSDTVWEHKLWNKTLVENVLAGVLEPHYYWQLEQQLLVANADVALFTVSDGTADNMESMFYQSVPERRAQLIAGWKQFAVDLATHEIKAKTEKVIAAKAESFPIITFEVNGSELTSNIQHMVVEIKERAALEMDRVLETDQDFADKEDTNKATKQARANLKSLVEDARNKFVSFSNFESAAKEIDSILQKMQSSGEKQVKQAKELKKATMIEVAYKEFASHLSLLGQAVSPLKVPVEQPDYLAAIKGKRTFDSMQDALDTVVAQAKISASEIGANMATNFKAYKELAGDHQFLFNDMTNLMVQPAESVSAIIKQRISEFTEQENIRKENERVQMQAEADRKAQAKAQAAIDEQARLEQAERNAQNLRERNARLQAEREEQAVTQVVNRDEPMGVAITAPVEPIQGKRNFNNAELVANAVNQWLKEFTIELPQGRIEELAGQIDAIYTQAALQKAS